MDMDIIVAVKEQYKYLLQKDIIAFYDNRDEIKYQLAIVALKLKQDAAGIAHGRTPHLLDVAKFANAICNDIYLKV